MDWAKTSDLECELICNHVGCCALVCISVAWKIKYGEVKLRAFLVPVVYLEDHASFKSICPHAEFGCGWGTSCTCIPCMLCTTKSGMQ